MPEDVEFYPDARPVFLTNGGYTIVDAEDVDKLAGLKISRNGAGYAQYGHGRFVHRLLAGARKGEHVDHINGDPLDNRKSNLRVATPKENAANRGTNRRKHIPFKGVFPSGRKWYSKIQVSRNPGPGSVAIWTSVLYETPEEAARAYDDAVRRLRPGPYERFNFPRPGERGLDGKLVPLPIPAQRSEEPSLCSPSACGSCPLNGLCGDPADLPPELPDVDPREPRPEGSLCCGGACGS